jgi:hypothetical protein
MPFDINGQIYNANSAYSTLDESVIQQGLLLHLNAGVNHSYPGSGGVVYDTSQYSHYGNLNNTTYSTDGSGSIVFNGTNAYGSITNTANLRPTSELTICMWIKATSITSGWNRLFGHDPYTSGGPLIFLESGGTLIRALHYPNGTEVRCNTDYPISTSVWTHAVFTFKTGDAIRSYFNGTASTTASLSSGTFSVNSSDPFLFGTAGASWYNGKISTIRMYNRALSAGEVSINFNAERTRHGV